MERPKFNCMATMIGSVPYSDADTGCARIENFLQNIPAWPQLPMRSNLENMYIQYSEGFPGITVDCQKISVVPGFNFDQLLEQVFTDAHEHNCDNYRISPEYAAGLYCAASHGWNHAYVKGQITGPISWGLCVTDSSGRGIIYDEILADAVVKFLQLKAAWMEKFLQKAARQTITFIDEPYLASLGSAFVSLSNEQVSSSIAEVLSAIKGLKGLHCCGGTDWSILLKLPIDILSFDAYNYLDSLLCYRSEVVSFIKGGGSIAWGIVPNDAEILIRETQATLYARFNEAIAQFAVEGLKVEEIAAHSLITPTCGLASLTPGKSDEALFLLKVLSKKVRDRYGL
ncbi:MAG: uroporphyrinogen decarboxylase/cobalamine-independent methonine synthase family protein [Dehalococcoidia bacterium]